MLTAVWYKRTSSKAANTSADASGGARYAVENQAFSSPVYAAAYSSPPAMRPNAPAHQHTSLKDLETSLGHRVTRKDGAYGGSTAGDDLPADHW